MPMRSTTLRAALLTSGFAVQSAYAYTQVNVPSPFMYKNIDPIVFAGEHSKSHLHSFFGSDAVRLRNNQPWGCLMTIRGCLMSQNRFQPSWLIEMLKSIKSKGWLEGG
jgi:hypothetical protein